MYARVSRFAGLPPERIEETLQQFQEGMLPVLEQQSGYRGVVVMVDRQGGAAVAMTYWETREDMRASDEIAEQARQQALETAQPRPRRDPVVDHYEVLLEKSAP